MRDVAHIRDGFAPQTNIVRMDGQRGALMSILKVGSASTLTIVEGVRKAVAQASQSLPPELKVSALFDQSVFVRAAIAGVVREGLIAAALTAAMILLFLGDWRPTIVISISIPLSIFISIILLDFLGQSINIMTLGGLALAVGILVDDATVEIENIERLWPRARRWKRPSSKARSRSPCRPSSPPSASASCSCRCSFSPVWPSSCSFLWRRPWYLPCWSPTSCRERWFPRW